MNRGVFFSSLLVVLLLIVVSIFQISKSDAYSSAPVRVTLVAASCDADGNVFGLITVKNLTNKKVSYSVPLMLAQHIPPSRGGDPKFQPVPGVMTSVDVNLAGGAGLEQLQRGLKVINPVFDDLS